MHRYICVWLIMLAVLVGCQTTATPQPIEQSTATLDLTALAQAYTPIATVALASPTSTATRLPQITRTQAPKPTTTPTIQEATEVVPTTTPLPTLTTTPTPTATFVPPPTATPLLERIDHYVLSRPIPQQDDLVHWVDATYPYGGTQFGQREVHLGVEFVNPRFTPIIAAAEGTVFFAGQDDTQQFGPDTDYYGNLIVIEHPFTAPEGGAVYTLYGHLQDISVETGQPIQRGQRIGQTGDTGIAIGPHLHFEVRVGAPTNYQNTRNPDLWIEPYRGFGTLAGRVTGISNTFGIVLQVRSDTFQRETYTYGSDRVNSDPSWRENFTLRDIPAGTYEVFISNNGRVVARADVSITAGATTWIELELD